MPENFSFRFASSKFFELPVLDIEGEQPVGNAAAEVFAEKKQTGSIGFKMTKSYFSMRYPFWVFISYLLFEFSSMLVVFFSDIWIKWWVTDVEKFKESL